jgi:hypothetical protein
MRILFTIPHFYQPRAAAQHGSQSADRVVRTRALTRCLMSLHQTFGPGQGRIVRNSINYCNAGINAHIEIVICTSSGHHLLDELSKDLFQHHRTDAVPPLLGYECHAVLAENLGRFDYYCFLEDDTLIADPLFFWKYSWFTASMGDAAVLQPYRFELSPRPPIRKVYIDGPPLDPQIASLIQAQGPSEPVRLRLFDRDIGFVPADNPHAGCFFLTSGQMARWSRQAYFLDRADDFCGPLESAATWGIMRSFEIYKPEPDAGAFLEVGHLHNRYLGQRRMRVSPL